MNPKIFENMGWAMAEVYAAVVDQILINLARHFKRIKPGQKVPGSWDYQVKRLAEMGQVTRETEEIILKNLGSADEVLQTMLEEAIVEGLKDAEPGLNRVARKRLSMGEGFLPPELHPKQMQAFQAYYRQSADKLNLVNTVMLESTQQAYQATVADIVNRISRTQSILNTETGEVITGVTSFNQAVRDGVKKMSDNGLTGFVDHGGHHWSPEAYVAMDVRSTVANTAREAVWERSEDYGCELYQVSWHNGARPLCYPWQGKVISKNGWTGEVEDDEGNKVHVYAETETSYGEAAGLFGVNCGHYPIPFFPGFSRIRPPQQDEEENAKEYEESQKQRQLERKLRNEKRDLETLKAQGASDEEIKAQRAKVKAARDNLNGFCEETGRARRSGREYRPIQADYKGADSGPFGYGLPDVEGERSIVGSGGHGFPSSGNEVATDFVESDHYGALFNNIADSAEADQSILSAAKTALNHRNGTDCEDLILLDSKTGEVLYKLDYCDVPHGVNYDDKINAVIEKAHAEGKEIISLHNHPQSYPPSLDDGASAFAHGYKKGVVVTHDGRVFVYSPAEGEMSRELCDAVHDMIEEQIQQTCSIEPWFTTLKDYGMIIEERRCAA